MASRCSWSAPTAPGLDSRGYQAQDGLRVAELTLSGVAVPESDVLGAPDQGLPVLEAASITASQRSRPRRSARWMASMH